MASVLSLGFAGALTFTMAKTNVSEVYTMMVEPAPYCSTYNGWTTREHGDQENKNAPVFLYEGAQSPNKFYEEMNNEFKRSTF